MRAFAQLYAGLDETTSTLAKRRALAEYFLATEPADAAWAVQLLSGGKLPRLVNSTVMRELASSVTGYQPWLIDESYAHVGDLAECLTLLVQPFAEQDPRNAPDATLREWVERIQTAATWPDEERRAWLLHAWLTLSQAQRFVLNKLLTGALRVGVSARLVHLALADASGLTVERISERLSGKWQPSATAFAALVADAGDTEAVRAATPYPFYLASPLEVEPASLGPPVEWLAEWKWDGIRAQLLQRDGRIALWSRGGEKLDGRFPEIELSALALPPGCALDGEILAWGTDAPRPFIELQPRINRLKPSANLIAQTPIRFLAYDLLELDGTDWRRRPLADRREALANMLAALEPAASIALSPALDFDNWEHLRGRRDEARDRGVEGLMLKRLDSIYRDGRKRGDWWKWKVDPHTIDAVLIYAQSGSGRRAGLHTDYTFALWQDTKLVPFAKAYSGLTDVELLELDRWIRSHTLERFGPVRSVAPSLVFELAFEAVQLSKRHKSGVAVRFPRILRWRRDKQPVEADSLDGLRALAGMTNAR